MIRLLIILFCLSELVVIANNPDSQLAIEKLTKANELLKSGNIGEVEELIQEGLTIFYQNDDLFNWINWHKTIGLTWQYTLKNPIKALDVYQNCLKNKWRNPQSTKEYEAKAWLLAIIGYAYKKTYGDLIAHRDCYLWASRIFTDTLEKEDFAVAKYIYHELGNTYTNLKDYDNAKFYLDAVRNISREAMEWERWAQACSDLGRMYIIKKEYINAVKSFEEALEKSSNLSFDTKLLLIENLGVTYYHSEDYENALEYTDKAKKIVGMAKISDEEREELFYDIHVNYGKIYRGLGSYNLSEYNYLEALRILKKETKGSNKREMVFLRIYLGYLYIEWGNPEAALKEFSACLVNLLPTFQASESFILPESSELTTERLLIDVFDKIAEIFMILYQQDQLSAYVKQAMECYKLGSKVEELLLQEYFLEGSSLSVLEDHRTYKENALAFLYQAWEKEPTAELAEFIFKISERSRAILLLENYQLSKTLKESNVGNEALLKEYEQQNNRIAELEKAIFELKKSDPESAQIDSLKKELHRSKEALAKITKKIMADSSNQAANTYGSIATIKDLQQSLSADQMLIEYFVGEEHIFIIGITQNDFHLWQKELPKYFEKTINDLIRSITDNTIKDHKSLFAASSFQLHNWLLKDVLAWKPEDIDRLVMVPDGLLGYVPFDLLISKKPEANFNYADLDYLIKHQSIGYAPSASLYLLQLKKEQKRAKKQFAGFAPKYKPYEKTNADSTSKNKIDLLKDSLTRDGIYDLPGAAEEVRSIAKLLNGDPYFQYDASESAFKQLAKDYQILLLSMHSLVDEDNPKFSTLLFTDSASVGEDDLLYALELSTLSLHADLAVLSACNTGFGKMNKGEGVMSFSRAFFSAGVPSTLMTLWKIPDASSSIIIKAFFKNLKDGLPKDKALQQAKLSYLKNAGSEMAEKPVFWAGFIAAGNMEPIDLNVGGFILFWWIGGLFLLLTAFLLYKYFK